MCRKAGGDDGACVALLAAGGAADCLSSIFRDTLWNSTIPDRLRGRVAGIEVVSYALGAPMAGVILGTLSRFTGSCGTGLQRWHSHCPYRIDGNQNTLAAASFRSGAGRPSTGNGMRPVPGEA
jgi:hypothetical protein